ncbi:MAG: NAD(+) synthase [Candidatus Geothermarchaeales archaeon]
MTLRIRDHFDKSGAEGILLGIDGELNSSVTALLCSRAIKGLNIHAIYLMDRERHSQANLRDINRVSKIGRFNLSVVEITPLNRNVLKGLPHIRPGTPRRGAPAEKAVSENLVARIRMVALYYYADYYRYLVCGNCDKSEWLLGHFTKWGDGSADILPLASLYKTQVSMVARALKIGFIAKKPPSTRLWMEESLLTELPILHEDLDLILLGIEKGWDDEEIAKDLDLDLGIVRNVRGIVEKNWHKRHGPILI